MSSNYTQQTLKAKLTFSLFQRQVRSSGCRRTEESLYLKGAGEGAAGASPQRRTLGLDQGTGSAGPGRQGRGYFCDCRASM